MWCKSSSPSFYLLSTTVTLTISLVGSILLEVECPLISQIPIFLSSLHFSSVALLSLQWHIQSCGPDVSWPVLCTPTLCSQCYAVDPCSYPKFEAVGYDVQCNQDVATQSIHQYIRKGWNLLFLHVRHSSSFYLLQRVLP